jgi:hypothetical protein
MTKENVKVGVIMNDDIFEMAQSIGRHVCFLDHDDNYAVRKDGRTMYEGTYKDVAKYLRRVINHRKRKEEVKK